MNEDLKKLIELRGLAIKTPHRQLLTGVDLDVFEGQITALMGPSGSGKSLSARCCMGYIDVDPGLTGGSLKFPQHSGDKDWFEGIRNGGMRAQQKLAAVTRQLRGSYVTYSPQAASSALNPGRTVGRQLELAMRRRAEMPADIGKEVASILDDVGLPNSASSALAGELSGGQCQRAALAVALAPAPAVLIADEPETGLDPVLTRQVIELMINLVRDRGCGMLLISHHEETVQRVADRVVRLTGGGHT